MLPSHVTKRIRNGDTVIADEEGNVSILFCDIVDLASFSGSLTPAEVKINNNKKSPFLLFFYLISPISFPSQKN